MVGLAKACRRSVVGSPLVVLVVALALPGPADGATRAFAVAGSGEPNTSANGVRATDAGGWFHDVAPLANGGFLVSASDHGVSGVVQRIDARGVVRTVASRRYGGPSFPLPAVADGGPATDAIFQPGAVAPLPDGGFLVVDHTHSRVRKVDWHGIITTVAGSERFQVVDPPLPFPRWVDGGDGGPATSAGLAQVEAIAVLPDGGFLIAGAGNRVRKVDARGIITTVAGTGAASPSGDGGRATNAAIGSPTSLAVLPDGGFLVAGAGRVRRVDRRGRITTVAGGGKVSSCYRSVVDGRAATSIRLDGPGGVAAIPRGGFVIADAKGVMKVDRRGIVSMLAGAPTCTRVGTRTTYFSYPARAAWSGLADRLGGSARDAFVDAWKVAVRRDGSVLVAGAAHVLALTTGARPPLAVALRPPLVRGGRISLRITTSRPGRASIEVRRAVSHRRRASFSRRVRAGLSTVALPRLAHGPYVVRVALRRGRSVVTDTAVVYSGPRLPVSLARAAISAQCCGTPAPYRRASVARAAEGESYGEGSHPTVVSCRRFSRTRVDCVTGERVCNEVVSARLRRGLIYLAPYRCRGATGFDAHPSSPPARVAVLLSR